MLVTIVSSNPKHHQQTLRTVPVLYLRPGAPMQLNRRRLLIRQPLKAAVNHVLGMAICQLGTGLDDAPACPLRQDPTFWRHVPCYRER